MSKTSRGGAVIFLGGGGECRPFSPIFGGVYIKIYYIILPKEVCKTMQKGQQRANFILLGVMASFEER